MLTKLVNKGKTSQQNSNKHKILVLLYLHLIKGLSGFCTTLIVLVLFLILFKEYLGLSTLLINHHNRSAQYDHSWYKFNNHHWFTISNLFISYCQVQKQTVLNLLSGIENIFTCLMPLNKYDHHDKSAQYDHRWYKFNNCHWFTISNLFIIYCWVQKRTVFTWEEEIFLFV